MHSWQWRGQPTDDFPAWLRFKNFARKQNVLCIDQLEGRLELMLGDWIDRAADGFVSVRKPDISWDERHIRSLA